MQPRLLGKVVGFSLVSARAALLFAPITHATTQTRSQNPALTVTSSLLSNGPDGNSATVGDQVTARGSVRNNTGFTQNVMARVTLLAPTGQSYTYSRSLTLWPHAIASESYVYPVSADIPRGTYKLTVAASNADGISSATSSLVVY